MKMELELTFECIECGEEVERTKINIEIPAGFDPSKEIVIEGLCKACEEALKEGEEE